MNTSKGKVQITNSVIGLKNITVGGYTVAVTFDTDSHETNEANAELIADAFELQNKCPRKPTEVFEALCSITKERDELLSTVRRLEGKLRKNYKLESYELTNLRNLISKHDPENKH